MIDIPEVPVGITALLGLFAPYLVSLLNGALAFITTPLHRKLVSIGVGVVLGVVVLVLYIAITGDTPGPWPEAWGQWVLLVFVTIVAAVGSISASYALATKDLGARALEERVAGQSAQE